MAIPAHRRPILSTMTPPNGDIKMAEIRGRLPTRASSISVMRLESGVLALWRVMMEYDGHTRPEPRRNFGKDTGKIIIITIY